MPGAHVPHRFLLAPEETKRTSEGEGTTPASEVVFAQTTLSERLSQLQQSVATLPGGGFGVVWEEGAFPTRNVRMQWLDPDGNPLFPPGGRLVAGRPIDEADAVIAAHPSAGAYVAFAAENDILVQYFDASGEPQWPGDGVVVVDRAPKDYVRNPHLVSNPGGGVFVCFQFTGPGPIRDIRCQYIDPAGARRWSTSGVSVGNGGDREIRAVPRGVSDSAGGLLLFWRNQRDPFSPNQGPMLMEGQRFAGDGSKPWGPAPKVVRTTRLATRNDYSYRFFNVVSDGNGGAVLAFDDWTGTSGPSLDVMAQRVSAAGDLPWGQGAVVTGANGHQQHDQTIGAPDGGAFVAVYESFGSTHSGLLLFRLGPDGGHVWRPEGLPLSDPRATALDYNVFGGFDSGFLRLAWTHQAVPATFAMDVHFAAYTLEGSRRGGTAGIPLTQAADGQFLQGLAYSSASDGVLAVWDDRRKGTWDDLDVIGATLKDPVWRSSGRFYTLTPCRLVDTRGPSGPYGGPPLASQQPRAFTAIDACGVPSTAKAIAANVTVVSPSGDGYLTFFPAGDQTPLVSTVNFRKGQTRSNNALLSLSFGGALAVFPVMTGGGTAHLVVDLSGYFD